MKARAVTQPSAESRGGLDAGTWDHWMFLRRLHAMKRAGVDTVFIIHKINSKVAELERQLWNALGAGDSA